MNKEYPIILKLEYDAREFEKIYFGNSLWQTYLSNGRKDTLYLFGFLTILLLPLLFIWQIKDYIIVPLIIFWCVQSGRFYWESVEFVKWYKSVLRISKNDSEYKNSELHIYQNWLILTTKSKEYRYNFTELKFIEIGKFSINLYFSIGDAIFLPKTSLMTSDLELLIQELDLRNIEIKN